MKSLSVEQNGRKSGRYIEASLKEKYGKYRNINLNFVFLHLHYGIDSPTNELINN